MKFRVRLDDELLEAAREYSPLSDTSELIQEGLKALIAREESRRRLIALQERAPGSTSLKE